MPINSRANAASQGAVEQPPVRGSQLLEQLAAPPQLREQPRLQLVRLQLAVSAQFMEQLLPAQSMEQESAELQFMEQLPPGQWKLHSAPALHSKEQPPPPGQVTSQLPPSQAHALPTQGPSLPQAESPSMAPP